MNDAERFWSKVTWGAADECWPWKAGKDKDGYGKFQTGKHRAQRHHRAHRYAFELQYGRPPRDVCRHTCDNPPCCNPAHLRDGTQRDNRADCVRRGRQARGERHGRAKLTESEARQVKRRLKNGDKGAAIARDLGVGRQVVYSIAKGITWAWL